MSARPSASQARRTSPRTARRVRPLWSWKSNGTVVAFSRRAEALVPTRQSSRPANAGGRRRYAFPPVHTQARLQGKGTSPARHPAILCLPVCSFSPLKSRFHLRNRFHIRKRNSRTELYGNPPRLSTGKFGKFRKFGNGKMGAESSQLHNGSTMGLSMLRFFGLKLMPMSVTGRGPPAHFAA